MLDIGSTRMTARISCLVFKVASDVIRTVDVAGLVHAFENFTD